MKEPQIELVKVKLRSSIFNVYSMDLKLEDGHSIKRDVVAKKKDSVLIIIQDTQAGNVYVQDEYRVGLGKITTGFPAGMIEPGEDPVKAAIREVKEETGYVVSRDATTVLDHGVLSEGFCTERTTAVLVRVSHNTVQGNTNFDDDESVANGHFVDLGDVLPKLTSMSAKMAAYALMVKTMTGNAGGY